MTLKEKKEMVRNMTREDLGELVKAIEEEFGVTSTESKGILLGFEKTINDEPKEISQLTLEKVQKKIRQYEIITGMSFQEYKRACESGQIKNYSSTGLDLWEVLEDQKQELLKYEPEE